MDILEKDKELIEHKIENTKTKRNFCSLIIKIIILIVSIFIIFNYLFGITQMNGISMNPKIADGDLIIYYRIAKDYNVGDVVSFKQNNKKYNLRIVAKEGQVVDINEKGEFLVDNHTLEGEIYYRTYKIEESKIQYPYKVEKNKVFLLGDFRTNSEDSRYFGTVDIKNIDGKLISVFRNRNI